MRNEKCTVCNKTLAEIVKTTPMTIANSLTNLEARGYIKRLFKDTAKRHRLEIIPLVVFAKVSFVDETKETQIHPQMKLDTPTDETRLHPQLNRIVLNNNKSNNIHTASPIGSTELKESFNLFWLEYPKKISKGTAEKAWIKIKPSKELVEKIILSVKNHKNTKQWKESEGKFIPHPTTFLNGKRYEDELVTHTAITSKYAKYS